MATRRTMISNKRRMQLFTASPESDSDRPPKRQRQGTIDRETVKKNWLRHGGNVEWRIAGVEAIANYLKLEPHVKPDFDRGPSDLNAKEAWVTLMLSKIWRAIRFSHPDIVAGIPPRPEPEGRDQLPSGHAVYTFKQDWQVELDDWGCKAILAIARGLGIFIPRPPGRATFTTELSLNWREHVKNFLHNRYLCQKNGQQQTADSGTAMPQNGFIAIFWPSPQHVCKPAPAPGEWKADPKRPSPPSSRSPSPGPISEGGGSSSSESEDVTSVSSDEEDGAPPIEELKEDAALPHRVTPPIEELKEDAALPHRVTPPTKELKEDAALPHRVTRPTKESEEVKKPQVPRLDGIRPELIPKATRPDGTPWATTSRAKTRGGAIKKTTSIWGRPGFGNWPEQEVQMNKSKRKAQRPTPAKPNPGAPPTIIPTIISTKPKRPATVPSPSGSANQQPIPPSSSAPHSSSPIPGNWHDVLERPRHAELPATKKELSPPRQPSPSPTPSPPPAPLPNDTTATSKGVTFNETVRVKKYVRKMPGGTWKRGPPEDEEDESDDVTDSASESDSSRLESDHNDDSDDESAGSSAWSETTVVLAPPARESDSEDDSDENEDETKDEVPGQQQASGETGPYVTIGPSRIIAGDESSESEDEDAAEEADEDAAEEADEDAAEDEDEIMKDADGEEDEEKSEHKDAGDSDKEYVAGDDNDDDSDDDAPLARRTRGNKRARTIEEEDSKSSEDEGPRRSKRLRLRR